MTLKSVCLEGAGWHATKGQLPATINVFQKAKWKANDPEMWLHPNGKELACVSDKAYEAGAIAESVAMSEAKVLQEWILDVQEGKSEYCNVLILNKT